MKAPGMFNTKLGCSGKNGESFYAANK